MNVFTYPMVVLLLASSVTAFSNRPLPPFHPANVYTAASVNAGSYWVFVGQFSPSKKIWLSKFFDNEDFPQVGQSLTAIKAANKRKSLPVKETNYKLTPTVGQIKSGQTIKVSDVKALVGNFYWVKVD